MSHNPEQWAAELVEAGWKRRAGSIWEAPNGALMLGPFHAWEVMKSGKEPQSEYTVRKVGARP